MFAAFCRLAVLVALGFQLGACINSDYDLSVSLKPEFPIKPGTYAKDKDSYLIVRRAGDAYRIYSSRNKQTTYAKLYKIPEYPDFLVQYYDRTKKPIIYLFLKPTDKGFEVYDVENIATSLPEHVVKLLLPISEDDKRDNNITIANGRRDTLYVVREVARANLKMKVVETYERRP